MAKIQQKMNASFVQLAYNPFLHGTRPTRVLGTHFTTNQEVWERGVKLPSYLKPPLLNRICPSYQTSIVPQLIDCVQSSSDKHLVYTLYYVRTYLLVVVAENCCWAPRAGEMKNRRSRTVYYQYYVVFQRFCKAFSWLHCVGSQ